MRKKLIILGLVLMFGVGLTFVAQANEMITFKEAKLEQSDQTAEVAVIQEGPSGGEPVVVDDHLKVTGFFFPEKGIVKGRSGGEPVIIGDHMRVDGWLFANAGIVNGAPGSDPVIIADHLRVEGEISRDAGAVKIKDDLTITGNISMASGKKVDGVDISAIPSTYLKAIASNSITDSMVKNDITASRYLPLSGGTITGNVSMSSGKKIDGVDVSTIPSTYFKKSGGTITGGLTVNGDTWLRDDVDVEGYMQMWIGSVFDAFFGQMALPVYGEYCGSGRTCGVGNWGEMYLALDGLCICDYNEWLQPSISGRELSQEEMDQRADALSAIQDQTSRFKK